MQPNPQPEPDLAHGTDRVKVSSLRKTESTTRKENMARRRYQVGSVVKRNSVWDFRYREDVVRADGTVERVQKRLCSFATVKECPTKRLALRHKAVTDILDDIQSPSYKPKTNST